MPVRKRNWGKSNPFSEIHRISLPGNFCLWDIDGIILNDEDEVIGIYEGKFSMVTKDRGNFIEKFNDKKNLQAGFLKKISNLFDVIIEEESTKKFWKVKKGEILEIESPSSLKILKTENIIYVEDILKNFGECNPSAIFLRTKGKSPYEFDKYVDQLSKIIGIKKILINDVLKENIIYFKGDGDIISKEISENNNWYQSWKALGII